jgi:NO-binding membrane sensor protein with MHYT domain
MTASYQPLLVILSILIAILVSYTALGLGARVIHADNASLKFWMLGGSFTMGLGIWAMHFIGMLAFHLPIALAYDLGVTLLSLLPAIIASAIALFTLRRGESKSWDFYLASVLMGGGIAGMYYTGMAAMRMLPAIRYDPLLFALSILIAILASGVALQLVFRFERSNAAEPKLRKPLAAVVMGRRGKGGSGLGLHIVYNLVTTTLKGNIALDETVDQGTRFNMEMPFQQESKA